MKLFYTNYRK